MVKMYDCNKIPNHESPSNEDGSETVNELARHMLLGIGAIILLILLFFAILQYLK